MKKLLTGFLLFASFGSHAQFYGTIGYNAAFPRLSGLNNVVANYNETRPWLDNEMGRFWLLDGLNFSFGGGASNFWYDLTFDFRGQKRSASGTDAFGNFNTRELKLKYNTMSFNFGPIIISDSEHMAYAFGGRAEVGVLNTFTRVFGESNEKGKFEEIGTSNLTVNFGPTFKIIALPLENGIFTFSMYYTWCFTKVNLTELDEELNNTDYSTLSEPQFDVRPSSFGLSAAFGFIK